MGHKEDILAVLSDMKPHTNGELVDKTNCLRYGAVIFDLRHKHHYDIVTDGPLKGKPGTYTYTLRGLDLRSE